MKQLHPDAQELNNGKIVVWLGLKNALFTTTTTLFNRLTSVYYVTHTNGLKSIRYLEKSQKGNLRKYKHLQE